MLNIIKDFDAPVCMLIMIFMYRQQVRKHDECENDRKKLWERLAKTAQIILVCLCLLLTQSCHGLHVSLDAEKREGERPVYNVRVSNEK